MAEAIWSVLQEGLSLSQVGKNIFNVKNKNIFKKCIHFQNIVPGCPEARHPVPHVRAVRQQSAQHARTLAPQRIRNRR